MTYEPKQHSFWPDGSSPQFLNPDFGTLLPLFSEQWDTLRIMAGPDGWAVASGYGNTHETLVKAWRAAYGVKRPPNWIAWVLYYEGTQAYLDEGDDEGTTVKSVLKYFTKEQAACILDLVRERGLVP